MMRLGLMHPLYAEGDGGIALSKAPSLLVGGTELFLSNHLLLMSEAIVSFNTVLRGQSSTPETAWTFRKKV
jgi:hypothetical protein